MAFFDGSFKKKRNISLGGVKQPELDREQLLRKSQEDRKARELDRLRNRSATRIQAFYRGRSDVRHRRAEERVAFEEELQSLDLGSAEPPEIARMLISLCRKLLFLREEHVDGILVEQLAAKLVSKVKVGSEGAYAALSPLAEPDYSQTWSFQLSKLVVALAAHIPKRPRMAAGDDSVSPELRLLELLLEPKHYAALSLPSGETDHAAICQKLAKRLVTHGFYRSLGDFFASLGPADCHLPNVGVCASLSIQPFRVLEPRSHEAAQAVDTLVQFVLTVPYLPNRMNIEAFTVLFAQLPFDAVVFRLSASPGSISSLAAEPSLSLLANLVAFGKPRVAKMQTSVLVAYLRALSIVLERIPPGMLPGTVLNEEEEEDDDDEDAQQPKNSIVRYPPLDPRVENAVSMVYEPGHLRSIFAFRGSQYDRPGLVALSVFLSTLLFRWSSRRVEVLSGVSQAGERDLLLACWQALREGSLHKDILEAKNVATILADPSYAEDWSILALLSEIYSRLLLTIGDDEFFSDKNAFSVDDLIGLSAALRNVTFALWWSDALSVKQTFDTTLGLHVRAAATKLLQQLHMRDARRPFCPEKHWIMTQHLNLPSFLVSLAAEEERLMEEEELVTGTPVSAESPKLRILHHTPFAIPFESRVSIFRHFVKNDRLRRERTRSETAGPHRADIRRDHVFEDGYTYLSSLGSKLKGRVAIRFIDEYGMHEAGIDGGGVFKEFMTALLKEALDTNCGLFTSTPDQMLYPNPHAYAKEERQLDHFKFLGLVLGKALYEGILVDAVFAPFFLNKWLGRLNYLDDLLSLDKDLYNGLIYLKNYTGDAEDLALNFTTTVSEFGSTKIIELISDGANVPVTNANKIRYIYLVANYRLNVEIDQQCRAFFSGLVQLINPKWLRMFNQLELQVLLSGAQRPIDVEDLRANVVYTSGYDEDHPVIHNFWAVVRAMSDEERRRLVRFVTSVERPPLLGFREMNPLITIQNTGGTGGRPDRLPTSSTCVNLLKLPPYPDQTMMRDKLLYAIYSGAGFDLS